MNTTIVVSAVVIAGAGVVKAWQSKASITKVLLGSYVFILLMSIMDMFGGGLADLASALSLLAVTTVLLTEIDWTSIIKTVQGKG